MNNSSICLRHTIAGLNIFIGILNIILRYNLGGSHGQIGHAYRPLGKSAYDVPLRKRRRIMLEMLKYKIEQKSNK